MALMEASLDLDLTKRKFWYKVFGDILSHSQNRPDPQQAMMTPCTQIKIPRIARPTQNQSRTGSGKIGVS